MIKTLVPQILTSRTLAALSYSGRAAIRQIRREPPVLQAFIEPGEPYSELLAQALPPLADRLGARIHWHQVGPPDASAAPERERLARWSQQDAELLAQEYGLDPNASPSASLDMSPLETGEALRHKLGHYASAMTWFEGEWFWGIDRLHFLENRLGGGRQDLTLAPPRLPETELGGEMDVYLSLRSPYSYLILERLAQVRSVWNTRIHLKPVLPMVMRNLPVPWAKRVYIVRDCTRLADYQGCDFGRIHDPLGPGVERGLAVLHHALSDNKGFGFALSFLRGAFSEGVDATTPQGLNHLAQRAGLSWDQVRAALDDESWKEAFELNRQALFEMGLWGVPSLSVDGQFAFGQDRLVRAAGWLENSPARSEG